MQEYKRKVISSYREFGIRTDDLLAKSELLSTESQKLGTCSRQHVLTFLSLAHHTEPCPDRSCNSHSRRRQQLLRGGVMDNSVRNFEIRHRLNCAHGGGVVVGIHNWNPCCRRTMSRRSSSCLQTLNLQETEILPLLVQLMHEVQSHGVFHQTVRGGGGRDIALSSGWWWEMLLELIR